MIEAIMFFGIGFFVASLVLLVLTPLVHNRAVRLTMKRLEAATPLSMAEIQADKDQLRAEFAMSTRRLEMSVEQMKAKTASQLAELSKKIDAINRLKVELGEKTATIFSLEALQKSLKDQLGATESERSAKIGALREAERMLQDKQAELSKVASDLHRRSSATDSQRVELTALRAQVEALKDRVAGYEREAHELGDRLSRERKEAAAASAELQEERARAEKLSDRVAQLERQLVTQTTEAEVLGRRVQEVEAQIADQIKVLSEREIEIAALRQKITEGQKIEADLRAELSGAAGRSKAASDGLLKEKALLEDQLNQARADRTKLQQEIASMRRDAEQTWAPERAENALLRERLEDVCAEIARLTAALEDSDSPMETMLTTEPPVSSPPLAADGDHGPAASGENKASLADRVLALQMKALRIPATS
jgi:chromosome segregation ATPase